MFQKVTIIGNLGGDPETRFLESGTSVCSFSIATNRKWTNADGSRGEETVWWRISAWGKLGEICQQYLNKGRLVFIEGEITPDRNTGGPRMWQDDTGNWRSGYDLRASTMKMLGGRGDDGEFGGSSYEAAPQARQQAAPARQQAAPAQRPQRPAQAAAPSGGARRSTMSAPQPAVEEEYDDYGSDEIPF